MYESKGLLLMVPACSVQFDSKLFPCINININIYINVWAPALVSNHIVRCLTLTLCEAEVQLYLAASACLSNTHTSLPAAALTLSPPLHSTASLNAAILVPAGPVIELRSPLGHIHTTGPVMKLWIFHRCPDTNCLFAVLPVSAALFWSLYVDRRERISPATTFLSFVFFLETGSHQPRSKCYNKHSHVNTNFIIVLLHDTCIGNNCIMTFCFSHIPIVCL